MNEYQKLLERQLQLNLADKLTKKEQDELKKINELLKQYD